MQWLLKCLTWGLDRSVEALMCVLLAAVLIVLVVRMFIGPDMPDVIPVLFHAGVGGQW